MDFHKISYNMIFAASSRFITALIGLAVISLLSRHLGQAGYGAYSTVLAYVFIFSVMADFGLHTIHVREISRYPQKEQFISSTIFTLRLILLLLVTIMAITISIFLPYSSDIKLGIFIATLFIIFSSLSQILGGIFQKYNTFYLVSLSDVFSRLIQLGLVFWAVKAGYGFLSFLLIVSFIAGIHFGIIFKLSRRFIKIFLKIDWSFFKKITKLSFPIAVSILFTTIYFRIDTIILSLMKSRADVGIYSLSSKVLESIIFFPALFTELIMPSLSYTAFKLKVDFFSIFKRAFNLLVIFAIPTVILLFILAEKIVIILAGQEFIYSAQPMKILAFAVGLIFLGNLGGRSLIALDLQRQGMWIYIIGAIFNVLSNIIVIPKYGYIGASFTTLFTEIIVIFSIFWLIYKKTQYKIELRTLEKVLLSGFFMSVPIYFFKDYNILIPAFIGLLAYFSFLYLIKGFTKEDIKILMPKIKS